MFLSIFDDIWASQFTTTTTTQLRPSKRTFLTVVSMVARLAETLALRKGSVGELLALSLNAAIMIRPAVVFVLTDGARVEPVALAQTVVGPRTPTAARIQRQAYIL